MALTTNIAIKALLGNSPGSYTTHCYESCPDIFKHLKKDVYWSLTSMSCETKCWITIAIYLLILCQNLFVEEMFVNVSILRHKMWLMWAVLAQDICKNWIKLVIYIRRELMSKIFISRAYKVSWKQTISWRIYKKEVCTKRSEYLLQVTGYSNEWKGKWTYNV